MLSQSHVWLLFQDWHPFEVFLLTFLKVDWRLPWHFSMVELPIEAVIAKVAAKLIVQRFCLSWCSSSSSTCRGTLPIGAPEGLGDIQIFAKSEFNSCTQNKVVTPCNTLKWKHGVLCIYPHVNMRPESPVQIFQRHLLGKDLVAE